VRGLEEDVAILWIKVLLAASI